MNVMDYYRMQIDLQTYACAYARVKDGLDDPRGFEIAKEAALQCYACCVALADHHQGDDPAHEVAHVSYEVQAKRWTKTIHNLKSRPGRPQVAPVSDEAQRAADNAARLCDPAAGRAPIARSPSARRKGGK